MATTPQRPDAAAQAGTKAGVKRPASEMSLEIAPDGKSKRFKGCSKISNYTLMSKLGEGTFGEVYKAESRSSGEIVAMKKILMHQEKDGFPVTALREIKLLKMLSHPNVLKLEEMAMERTRGEGRKKANVYMVTPYMDHDLSGLLENPSVHFSEAHLKCYMMQLLEGVAYLHKSKILHRDMKAANLLINNEGILQIADFGLARPYDDPPPKPGKGNGEATRSYTSVVVTRWYRPPELLLGLRHYTPAIDIWGVGCVFGEMFEKKPILAGHTDLNQLQRIFELVGSPTENNMPGWTQLPGCEGVKTFTERQSTLKAQFRDQGPLFISLLSELMKLDWRKRVNAVDALEHPYFKTEPLPARPSEIPQFQESHELDRRKFREQRQNPPPAPAGGTVGMGPDADFANGAAQNGAVGQEHSHAQRSQYRERQQYPPRRPGWEHPSQRGPPESRPPPLSSNGPPTARRPAWEKSHTSNALPPRPPVDIPKGGPGYQGGRSFDGGRVPVDGSSERPSHDQNKSRFRGGGPPAVDTYIPAYGPRDANWRSRDDEYRRRDEPPRRDDRERVGDRREGRDERDIGRRRSRSPPYRDRDRDRDRDRNRDLYRR